MNLNHPLIPSLIMAICMGGYVYYQSSSNEKRVDYLTVQIDVLRDQVAGLKAQQIEMNDTLKWMRAQWYK